MLVNSSIFKSPFDQVIKTKNIYEHLIYKALNPFSSDLERTFYKIVYVSLAIFTFVITAGFGLILIEKAYQKYTQIQSKISHILHKLDAAAVQIQRTYRGYIARKRNPMTRRELFVEEYIDIKVPGVLKRIVDKWLSAVNAKHQDDPVVKDCLRILELMQDEFKSYKNRIYPINYHVFIAKDITLKKVRAITVIFEQNTCIKVLYLARASASK